MTTPRSLADDLRGRDDDELQQLLLRRADLAVPVPGDVGQLAGRSVTAASTARALDHLDRFHLQVLEATVACDEPFVLSDVLELFDDAAADRVTAAVANLFSLALLWGEPDAWRPTVALREALGRFPGGLGPPLAHTGGGDLDRLRQDIADAPPESRQVLGALRWGPPTGRVRDADRPIEVRGRSDAG